MSRVVAYGEMSQKKTERLVSGTRMGHGRSGLGRVTVTESRMDCFSNSHLNDTNPSYRVAITKRRGGSFKLTNKSYKKET
jgi:hypothetical protein